MKLFFRYIASVHQDSKTTNTSIAAVFSMLACFLLSHVKNGHLVVFRTFAFGRLVALIFEVEIVSFHFDSPVVPCKSYSRFLHPVLPWHRAGISCFHGVLLGIWLMSRDKGRMLQSELQPQSVNILLCKYWMVPPTPGQIWTSSLEP